MFDMFTNNALDNMIFFFKFCSSKSVLASPTIKGSTDCLMLHLRGTELVEYSQLITVGFFGP